MKFGKRKRGPVTGSVADLPQPEICCPHCGSNRVLPIVYGALNHLLMGLVEQGRIWPGGAMGRLLSGEAPNWLCSQCRQQWRGGLFAGGNGSTPEQAVLIHGAGCTAVGIRAEKQYLTERFGLDQAIAGDPSGWVQTMQGLVTTGNGREYDMVNVALPGGSTAVVFFDITEFFGKPPP
jgi:hypothetical protein